MAIQTTYSAAPVVGFAGEKADNKPQRTVGARNAEASAAMPFGAIIAFKTSSPATDKDAILPAATSARLMGLVAFGNDFERTFTTLDGNTVGELNTVGLLVGAEFVAIEAGTYWVTCEGGCVPGDRLWVRIAGGTLGAARASDATGSTCVNATNCGKWLTTAADGALAKLEFDFLAATTAGA